MNGGYAQFFIKQSVCDTRKGFHVATTGRVKHYGKKHLPVIRRSLKVGQSEPAHNIIGIVLLSMIVLPLLLTLVFLSPVIPVIAVICAFSLFFFGRRKSRSTN